MANQVTGQNGLADQLRQATLNDKPQNPVNNNPRSQSNATATSQINGQAFNNQIISPINNQSTTQTPQQPQQPQQTQSNQSNADNTSNPDWKSGLNIPTRDTRVQTEVLSCQLTLQTCQSY